MSLTAHASVLSPYLSIVALDTAQRAAAPCVDSKCVPDELPTIMLDSTRFRQILATRVYPVGGDLRSSQLGAVLVTSARLAYLFAAITFSVLLLDTKDALHLVL